jgi:hypothetical protein
MYRCVVRCGHSCRVEIAPLSSGRYTHHRVPNSSVHVVDASEVSFRGARRKSSRSQRHVQTASAPVTLHDTIYHLTMPGLQPEATRRNPHQTSFAIRSIASLVFILARSGVEDKSRVARPQASRAAYLLCKKVSWHCSVLASSSPTLAQSRQTHRHRVSRVEQH